MTDNTRANDKRSLVKGALATGNHELAMLLENYPTYLTVLGHTAGLNGVDLASPRLNGEK